MSLSIEKSKFCHKRGEDWLSLEEGEDYISREIADWLLAEKFEDEKVLSQNGLRYSPEAIRCLLNFLRPGYIYGNDEQMLDLRVPNEKFFVANAGVYGLINGFFSHEEYETFNKGVFFRNNHPKDLDDIYRESNKVFSSVGEMAEKVKKMKENDSEVKSVLFHGKWNGIPHAGHILYMTRSLGKILAEYDVKQDKMVVMVACDSNQYITEVSYPFLDTDWRMSLMSYLPVIDMVCCSGDFSVEQAGKVWEENYQVLRPDFIPIEVRDKLSEEKIERATKFNIKPVLVERELYLDDKRENRMSMTGLLKEGMDYENFEKTNQKLLDMVGLNWQRDWFK